MDTRLFYFDELNGRMMLKNVMRKGIWIILVTVCFFAVSLFIQLNEYEARYSSRATISVHCDKDLTYKDIELAKEYAKEYVTVFRGKTMVSHAKEIAGMTDKTVSLYATQISGTNLIEIATSSPDPEVAHRIIEATIEGYNDVLEDMHLSGTAHVVQGATEPEMITTKPGLKTPITMAVFGLIGSVCVVAILPLFKPAIRTKAGAKRRLKGRCLGTVHQVHGSDGLSIDSAGVDSRFVDECFRMANQVEDQMRLLDKKVLLIAAATKQEGVTTVAQNLALALREKGRKVVTIDCSRCEDPGTAIGEGIRQADYVIVDAKAMEDSIETEVLSYAVDATLLVVRQNGTKLKMIREALWKLEASSADYLGYVLNGWTTEN